MAASVPTASASHQVVSARCAFENCNALQWPLQASISDLIECVVLDHGRDLEALSLSVVPLQECTPCQSMCTSMVCSSQHLSSCLRFLSGNAFKVGET